ncbi:MAG: hypothetical protein V3U54_03885 [Thermodesulfobacteriota bacterium]
MLQIMCWVDPEDFDYLDSMSKRNEKVDYYGYLFEVEGGPETGESSVVKVVVVELISAKMAVGLAIPNDLKIDGEFKIGFISHYDPNKDIPFVCKLSNEVKRTNYMGDDLEKLEYIGFTLEKFYENKGAKFYLHDLRGAKSSENE